MTNILITGGTGFIGSHLVKFLDSKAYSCYIVYRKNSVPNYKLSKSHFIEISGTKEDFVSIFSKQKIDLVIHLATKYVAEHTSSDLNNLIASNIVFGTNLLEAMKECGVKKFINTASSWQYFSTAEPTKRPANLYASTKNAFESILDYYCDAKHVKCISLILFDTYGKQDFRKKLIPYLINCLGSNQEIEMSPGNQVLNLTHINDIVKGYQISIDFFDSLMDKGNNHKHFCLRSSDNISLRELVNLIQNTSSKDLNILWGYRNYRDREVMSPWQMGQNLPNWKAQTSLIDGLLEIIQDNE